MDILKRDLVPVLLGIFEISVMKALDGASELVVLKASMSLGMLVPPTDYGIVGAAGPLQMVARRPLSTTST